jgi:hypothetical protein
MSARSGQTASVSNASAAAGNAGLRVVLDMVFAGPDGGQYASYHDEYDSTLLQLAQMTQSAFMALESQTIKETGATTQTINSAMAANTPTIEFGTNTAAVTFTDYAIGTAAGGTNPVTATVNAISGSTFTVTATWSNTTGSSVAIAEVAMYVTSTAGVTTNKTYALTHDSFSAVTVSNGGTAAATLSFTWS